MLDWCQHPTIPGAHPGTRGTSTHGQMGVLPRDEYDYSCLVFFLGGGYPYGYMERTIMYIYIDISYNLMYHSHVTHIIYHPNIIHIIMKH